MTTIRLPSAFISYRHTEYDAGADVDVLNRQHRAWVEQFVSDLRGNGVEAIFDGHIRELFQPYTTKDPFHVAFLAELSTIACLICHAFIPVLTPSYIDRLGYAGYRPQTGARQSFVLEEWQLGHFYCNHGVMQYVPVIRAGEPERMAALPLGVRPDNAFDMRDPVQIRFIAERIYQGWEGGAALITVSLGEWMAIYIDWCRKNDPRCADARVDAWSADLFRPRLFLEHVLRPRGSVQTA